MKLHKGLSILLFVLAVTTAVFADSVAVDYDHEARFRRVKTYSWSEVHTSDSIWNDRVRHAIDRELTAKGWTEVPRGGDVSIAAIEKTSIHRQFDTYYDGFDGRRMSGLGMRLLRSMIPRLAHWS